MRIGSVVVTYFPNENTLKLIQQLIDNIYINRIIIVDNTDDEVSFFEKGIFINDKLSLVANKKNLGIAKALNQGIDHLVDDNYDWVLTMDQDSLISPGLLEKYKLFIEKNNIENVGMLGTNYIDIYSGKIRFSGEWNEREMSEVISSGSLVNLRIFSSMGGFKEKYFIDQVDNEYCYRLKTQNYKILLLNGVDMEHSMGQITHKKIGFKLFFLYNQKPIRTYYRTRNIIFMIKEYKDFKLTYSKIISLCKDFIKIAFEENKKQKYFYFFKGLKNGLFGGSYDNK